MLLRAAHRFASHLFGGTCLLCRGAADAARDEGLLCAACDADLPRMDDALCPRCALPSPDGVLCGRCLSQPPAYDATVAALQYRFPADVLVHALKFRGELALAAPLGRLLGARVARVGERVDVDCVLPVPLSAARLRARGYNQSLEIGRHAARALSAPLAAHACERGRDTPPQSALRWDERAKNVRGAFRCTIPLQGATVAVVDDVMTTGATLEEIAATLKRAGAARVVNWVVARTFSA
ncbi:MAG TPA: ComF family protein [Burkholderiales bacterium]|nr:ComF family protein [Burkholderiales bacterium]